MPGEVCVRTWDGYGRTECPQLGNFPPLRTSGSEIAAALAEYLEVSVTTIRDPAARCCQGQGSLPSSTGRPTIIEGSSSTGSASAVCLSSCAPSPSRTRVKKDRAEAAYT